MKVDIAVSHPFIRLRDRKQLRERASNSINNRVEDLEDLAPKRMKQIYTFKRSTASVTSREESTPTSLTASLQYRYQPVPLTHFHYRSIPYAPGAVGVKVKIFRDGPFKFVTGKLGYKGFLQHNTVYERMQQPTWADGKRLPYRQLFGPSVSQMMSSDSMMKYFRSKAVTATAFQGLFD